MGGQVSIPSPSKPSSAAAATKSSSNSQVKETQSYVEQTKGAGTSLWLALTNKGFGDAIMAEMEKCVDECVAKGENGKRILKKCVNARALMERCLYANYDYVEPLLRAESDALDDLLWEAKKSKWAKKIFPREEGK